MPIEPLNIIFWPTYKVSILDICPSLWINTQLSKNPYGTNIPTKWKMIQLGGHVNRFKVLFLSLYAQHIPLMNESQVSSLHHVEDPSTHEFFLKIVIVHITPLRGQLSL
jgi:hypothetical protein